jgi:cell division protein FtsZ
VVIIQSEVQGWKSEEPELRRSQPLPGTALLYQTDPVSLLRFRYLLPLSFPDAFDAASYVQELAGDDVNIIFGAMYDESKSDSCTITVIATGLEDKANSVVQNRLGGGAAFRQPASHMTPSSLKGMNIQSTAPTTSQGQGGQAPRPIQPVPGIHKPTDIRSSVEEKSLKIPDFLQKK